MHYCDVSDTFLHIDAFFMTRIRHAFAASPWYIVRAFVLGSTVIASRCKEQQCKQGECYSELGINDHLPHRFSDRSMGTLHRKKRHS